ncbi:MAG: hypothetical protein HQM13_16810 [SAR324 cluster bacterium]|nr:hypothetical protein [SAR324 cluster bacterium]
MKKDQGFTKPGQEASTILSAWCDRVKQQNGYWKNKGDQIYERKMILTDPAVIRINHIRQTFHFYLLPAIEQALKNSKEYQVQFVRFLKPVFSEENFTRFLGHFFAIQFEAEDRCSFQIREDWEQDVFVIYDLFKTKKTMDSIDVLIQEIEQDPKGFPSQFHPEEQIKILKSFQTALLVTFKQSIKPEHQREFLTNISSEFLSLQAIQQRKAEQTIFARAETFQGNPYRRIFLHILFRENIKTRIKGKESNIRFSMLQYAQIRQEYLQHWVQKLGNHPEKMAIYQNLFHQGKSFAEWISEDPQTESNLMAELPMKEFDETMDEIREKIEPELRCKVEPLSEKSPIFKKINRNFQRFLDSTTPPLLLSAEIEFTNVLQQLSDMNSSAPEKSPEPAGSSREDQFGARDWQPFYREELQNHESNAKVVILMDAALMQSCQRAILEIFHELERPVRITTPANIRKIDLLRCSLILTVCCQLPSIDQQGLSIELSQLKAEIVDSELPLDHFPSPADFEEQSPDIQKQRFALLRKKIETREENHLTTDRYHQTWRVFHMEDEKEKNFKRLSELHTEMKTFLPQYQLLISWLIREAIEESGYQEMLIKNRRCLVVDDFGNQSLEFLSSIGFEPHFLESWNQRQLEEKITEFKKCVAPAKQTVGEFLKDSSLEHYDVVFLVNWAVSSETQLPVYIRINEKNESKSSLKLYEINFFHIFDENIPFLKYAFSTFQKQKGIAIQIKVSKEPLTRFWKRKIQEINIIKSNQLLDKEIEALKNQIRSDGENTLDFEKHWQLHLLHRIEFFVRGHLLKKSSRSHSNKTAQ